MQHHNEALDYIEAAMESADAGWWYVELPAGVMFYSPNVAKIIGREDDDFFHHSDFTKHIHPKDYPAIEKAMLAHLKGKTDRFELLYRMKHANGRYITVLNKAQKISQNGDEIVVGGIVMRINSKDKKVIAGL